MPCRDIMTQNMVRLAPDDNVESALQALADKKASIAVVVDPHDETVLGIFSRRVVMNELLPVSVEMGGASMASVGVGAAPGIAMRYRNLKTTPVAALLSPSFNAIYPDTPLWEAISLILSLGEGLPVLDEDGKLLGVVTQDDIFDGLESGRE